MAFARQVITASGADPENITITFPYLLEEHVVVSRNGTVLVQDTDYLIVSTTTLRFNSATSVNTAGDNIVVQRATSQDDRLVDYATASTMVEADFDTDSLQAFYMAQEALDISELPLGLDATDNFTAEDKQIKDVATPTDADDAVTKEYVDALTILASNIPTPDDPGDDGAILVADSGTYDWQPGDAAGNPYVVKDTGVLQDFQRPTDDTAQGIGFKNADGTRSGIIQNSSTSGGGIHISKREGSTVKAGINLGDAATFTIAGTDRLRVDTGDAQGELMVRQATQYEGFAVGTLGNALITKGAAANPEWFPIGQWIAHASSPLATTAGTTVDFTSIPADVDELKLILNGVGFDGTEEPLIRIGDASGFLTSGYIAHAGGIGSSTAAGGDFDTGFGTHAAAVGAADRTFFGVYTLTRLTSAGLAWMMAGSGVANEAGAGVTSSMSNGRGVLAGRLTRLRLTSTGTPDDFDAGEVYLFYRRNPVA